MTSVPMPTSMGDSKTENITKKPAVSRNTTENSLAIAHTFIGRCASGAFCRNRRRPATEIKMNRIST
uniref:Uncharacterized protein n=1 Tax=Anopheles minimus TaxID=112268 RepID=A0A182WNS4_9DIPT